MPIYKQFDVVVVPPFTDSNRTKKRPALVLSDCKSLAIDKTILAMIICEAVSFRTTLGHSPWSLDIVIEDLESTGLRTQSIIRFKLFTLDNSLITKKIGLLSEVDRTAVVANLKRVFNFV